MSMEFNASKLLLCEGKSDAGVFRQIIRKKSLADFDVDHPRNKNSCEGGGVDRLGEHLRAIRVQEDFITNVKKIVLIGDNDDKDAFERICAQLKTVGVTPPKNTEEFVELDPTGKRVCIFLVPTAEYGCLETLCTQAALKRWDTLAGPLYGYRDSSPAKDWPTSKKSKMELQCILAATCRKRPEVMLADLWQKNEDFHFPVDDEAFRPVWTFLSSL